MSNHEAATSAPELAALAVAGGTDPWRAAGFACDKYGAVRIGRVRVEPEGPRPPTWCFRGNGPEQLDGVTTTWIETPSEDPITHPNGATLIDHVVVLTPDVERTAAAYAEVGLTVRRIRHTDQYGPPFRQTFFRAGEVILELIGPEEPSGEGPTRVFGIACTVADLDRAASLLGGHLGAIKDAVQPGRRIATVRTKELGISITIALMSPEPSSPLR